MLEWFWVFISYLIGSVPFGLVIARIFCRVDPQKAGSGNIGATNVTRLCGLPAGIATLLFDAGKGAAAVFLGTHLTLDPAAPTDSHALFVTLFALAALLGHMHSIFLKFKGGKAVATTLGIFLYLAPLQTLLAAVLCLLVIAWKKYVSLGSLVLVVSLPLILLACGRMELLPLASVNAVLVINAHRANIGRLLRGEEKTWMRSKKSSGRPEQN
ncbi:MAG: glycerol-3-phosphate 1-O-acyltransferase PlsY [Desulfovibrionaceae bacterium]|nr:glycerol-3-phosphate 1-O-acyltransferase PlsY [Desulfovibrionaceae bacterium]